MQGLGEHMRAIKVLDDGLQLAEGERQVYLTYLRGKQACSVCLLYRKLCLTYSNVKALQRSHF